MVTYTCPQCKTQGTYDETKEAMALLESYRPAQDESHTVKCQSCGASITITIPKKP